MTPAADFLHSSVLPGLAAGTIGGAAALDVAARAGQLVHLYSSSAAALSLAGDRTAACSHWLETGQQLALIGWRQD